MSVATPIAVALIDTEREFSHVANSCLGAFREALMAKAKKNAWTVISVTDDWKKIFVFQK